MSIIDRLLAIVGPESVDRSAMKLFGGRDCFPAGCASQQISADDMYFQIRLNQMSLARNADWFGVYDPLVVVTVGFNYGAKPVEIPVILGPGTIQKHLSSGAPLYGTVLTNLTVTGPHPYRGDGLKLSVSFYRVKRKSYTKSLIKMIERLSSMIGMDQVGTIANTAGAIVDGLEGLLGGGETVCLAAHQFSLPEVPYSLESKFIALIMPPVPANQAGLLVESGRLFEKTANDAVREFASADFVLLSIVGMPRRGNANLFPPYELKRQAMQVVGEGEPSRKRAKALLLSALQQLRASNDFTKTEADLLFEEWIQEFTAEVKRYDAFENFGPEAQVPRLPVDSGKLNGAIDRLDL